MIYTIIVFLLLSNVFFLYRAYSFSKHNLEIKESLKVLAEEPSKDEKEVMNESFLKFVSDSRDWAFKYIEDVQKGLSKFVNEVDKDIKYFDSYGSTGLPSPNTDILKKISIAYKELKDLLPEENNN